MRAAGMPLDPELVRLDSHDAQQAGTVVRELVALPTERRPTAIFTGNNRHTVGALRALRGLEGDIALVGFDDLELADLLAVPTTVVRHESGRLGAEAAALLFARLDGDESPAQARDRRHGADPARLRRGRPALRLADARRAAACRGA